MRKTGNAIGFGEKPWLSVPGLAAAVVFVAFSLAHASPSRTQAQAKTETIAALTPAENCLQNAVPRPVTAPGTKVRGFQYFSVCVRPYKPDPEYARLQTPSGETRNGFSLRNASSLWIIQVAYGSGMGKFSMCPNGSMALTHMILKREWTPQQRTHLRGSVLKNANLRGNI